MHQKPTDFDVIFKNNSGVSPYWEGRGYELLPRPHPIGLPSPTIHGLAADGLVGLNIYKFHEDVYEIKQQQ